MIGEAWRYGGRRERQWNAALAATATWAAKHGRLPHHHPARGRARTEEQIQEDHLAIWVHIQRQRWRTGDLLPEREQQLDQTLPGWRDARRYGGAHDRKPERITAREAASLAGIHAKSWRPMATRGLVPRQVARGLWDRREVERWIAARHSKKPTLIRTDQAAQIAHLEHKRFLTTAEHDGLKPAGRRGHSLMWDEQQVRKWARTRRTIRRPGEKPIICSVVGCDRPAVAHGLCLMHYKQARKRGLEEHHVGDPDGYGRWGIIDTDGERVLCHECGRWFRSLGHHLGRGVHGMTILEYRERHGIPAGQSLAAPELAQHMSYRSRMRVGSVEWQRMVARRDPAAAAHARDAATFDLVSRTHRQRRRE